jgi:hypothetical protein
MATIAPKRNPLLKLLWSDIGETGKRGIWKELPWQENKKTQYYSYFKVSMVGIIMAVF